MPSSKVIIVPPFSAKRNLSVALILGMLCSIFSEFVMDFSFYLENKQTVGLSYIILARLAALFIGPLVFATISMLVMPRRLPILLVGFMFWLGLAAPLTTGVYFFVQNHAQFIPSNDLAANLIWWIWFPIAGCIMHSLFLGCRCVLPFRVIEDDRSHCLSCSYEYGSEKITRCPECGTDAQPRIFRANKLVAATDYVQRHYLSSMAILIALFFVPVAWLFTTQTLPSYRFMWQHKDDVYVTFSSVGVLLDQNAETMLVINLGYGDSYGEQRMFIVLATPVGPKIEANLMNPLPIDTGNPEIIWELTSQQAEYIRNHGIPREMIQQAEQAIVDYNWSSPGLSGRTFNRIRLTPQFDPK